MVLVMILALLSAPGASAETVAQTVQKWGLVGPWSQDCSLKPDRNTGTVLDYEIADDRVVLRRNFGDSRDEGEVVTAEAARDGLLNLRVFFPSLGQTREYGLMMQPDGTARAIYNRDEKKAYSIKDGKITANGNATAPLHKCR